MSAYASRRNSNVTVFSPSVMLGDLREGGHFRVAWRQAFEGFFELARFFGCQN